MASCYWPGDRCLTYLVAWTESLRSASRYAVTLKGQLELFASTMGSTKTTKSWFLTSTKNVLDSWIRESCRCQQVLDFWEGGKEEIPEWLPDEMNCETAQCGILATNRGETHPTQSSHPSSLPIGEYTYDLITRNLGISTCTSSRQIVFTGKRLICACTGTVETVEIVQSMTRGFGSMASTTSVMSLGSTSSKDKKGMSQDLHTLRNEI